MQFWAMIIDSFRESLDRKIFWVLIALSVLVACAMACIGVEDGRVNLMFGLWAIDVTTPPGDWLAKALVYGLMDNMMGGIGIMLTIIATASFFPTMMERGAIDVVLGKPIGRAALFMGKYLGSMVFVLMHASVFVGLTFLVAGLRWGVWLPGYLLSIPLLVLMFSYLYCISAWVAVRFRNTLASVMLTLAAWTFFVSIQGLAGYFEMYPGWQENKTVYNVVRAVKWITPKTQDITYLAARWSGAGTSADLIPEEVVARDEATRDALARAKALEREQINVSALETIGSSLVFEALVLASAMWMFSRKDF